MAEYDVSIERKGASKLNFNLCDHRGRPSRARGAFNMVQFPQLALKMQQGDTDHSDREPPYASREQLDFSGGRAWDDFEKDKSRFYDSYRAQTWHEGRLILGPEETYIDGIRMGSSVIVNGTFDTDTDWSKGTGWTIAAGVANCDGSQVATTYLTQEAMVVGQKYRATFTISNYVAGSVQPFIGVAGPGTVRSANGTYTEIMTCLGNGYFYLAGDTSFSADIDNVIIEGYWAKAEYWFDDNEDTDYDMDRVVLDGDTEYYSMYFAPDVTFTPKYIQMAFGVDFETDLWRVNISVYSDSAGKPGSQLMTTGPVQPVAYEHTERFEFLFPVELSIGSIYHVVVRNYQPAPGGYNQKGYYVLASDSLGFTSSYRSSDGSSWTLTSKGMFFRLLADDTPFDIFPFEHLGALYMALSYRDGSAPRIFMNGERGQATSGAATTITDSAAVFVTNELTGAIVVLYSGKGADVDRPWRLIASNTATAITAASAWDDAPDETTKYVIVKRDVFTEVLDHGMTGRITDVCTFGNIVYFCRGDFFDIFHMYDDTFALEQGNRGSFMKASVESSANGIRVYLARASYPPTIYTALPEFADDGWTIQDLVFTETVAVGDASCEADDASWADYGPPTTNIRDNSPVIDGLWSRGIAASAADQGAGQTITTISGARYRIEGHIYNYGANDVKIEFDGSEVSAVSTTGAWVYSYGYRVAAGTTATLRMLSKGGAASFNFDAIKVIRVDTPLPSGHNKITGLVVAGNPKRLIVMTDAGILTESAGSFIDISPGEFQNVRDYRNGAVAINKGDFIYTSFLSNVVKYFDEEIGIVGPNVDEGLPAARRGTIKALITYEDWLLVAVDGGDDNVSSILLYNGIGWHEYYRAPAAGMRITGLYIQSIPGDHVDRLWFNEGADLVWLGIDSQPWMNSDYKYNYTGWVDMSTIYGSMGEIEKFFQSIKVTADDLGTTHYISTAPRGEGGYSNGGEPPSGESYQLLWGTFTEEPSDEITIDEFWSMDSFTLRRLQIHIGLHTTRRTFGPNMRSMVIDFLEHVPVAWSYTLRLVTSDNRPSLTGERAGDEIQDDLATLKTFVNSAEPVRLTTPFSYADEMLVKLISISEIESVGYTRRNDRERSMFVLSAVDV